jgi:tripartite-type tricarboxylate transporter receptor subunit TctC
MNTRRIVSAFLLAAATGLWLASAAAAEYPARPVSLIVAFTPGGPSVLARIIGKKIGELLGQPVVIENPLGRSRASIRQIV